VVSPRGELRQFLTERFEGHGELERFAGDFFDEVKHDVAWERTSLAEKADDFIDALVDRNLIDELWTFLKEERPEFAAQIDQLAGSFAASPPEPRQSARSLAQKAALPWVAAGVAAAVLAVGLFAAIRGGGVDPAQDSTPTTAAEATPPSILVSTTNTTSTDSAAAPEAAPPRPLEGDVRIAIASFSVVPEDDTVIEREAMQAAEDLGVSLKAELGSLLTGLTVDVGMYERPGGNSPQPYDLEAFAAEVGANIVVTAEMESDLAGSKLVPTFYVPEGQLQAAEELTGEYALGMPAEFETTVDSIAVRNQVRQTLRSRSCLLAHYVAGLSFYREALYDEAAAWFQQAVDQTSCAPVSGTSGSPPGAELAYYFVGNINALAGDLDAADANYRMALTINDQFTRARFGQAEILFQREREACVPDIEPQPDAVENLRLAREQYLRAFSDYAAGLDAGRQRIPFLETSARLRLGRVELCLSQADEPAWDEARSNFEQVVDAHRFADTSDKVRLREFAAEAYAGLGLIDLTDSRLKPNPIRALDSFTRALELEPRPDRAAMFLAMRARAHLLLGDGLEQEDCGAAVAADPSIVFCSPEALAEVRAGALTAGFVEFLPFTGLATWMIVLIGFALVGGGTVIVLGQRSWLEKRSRLEGSSGVIDRGSHGGDD